ncbi:hypothetical protein [Aliikangiella sp. IMCC44359]|uniref:hypothetical protein n=1 Tax=Aliikangiella sp. IMCC44359 TaxID=3459125 RepID=UPI00403AD602
MISDDLKYPSLDAVKSVLTKIGVDISSRDLDCQDYEYTTCKLSELEKYIALYQKNDTSIHEKRVLGCYMMEGLNDYVAKESIPHPLQEQVFEFLHADYHIHQTEIEYRLEIDDLSEDEWWPITKYILEWQSTSKFI